MTNKIRSFCVFYWLASFNFIAWAVKIYRMMKTKPLSSGWGGGGGGGSEGKFNVVHKHGMPTKIHLNVKC